MNNHDLCRGEEYDQRQSSRCPQYEGEESSPSLKCCVEVAVAGAATEVGPQGRRAIARNLRPLPPDNPSATEQPRVIMPLGTVGPTMRARPCKMAWLPIDPHARRGRAGSMFVSGRSLAAPLPVPTAANWLPAWPFPVRTSICVRIMCACSLQSHQQLVGASSDECERQLV